MTEARSSTEALVVGSAQGVWEDLRAASALLSHPTIVAVNLMVLFLPRVDHAVSHHGEALVHLVAHRRLDVSLSAAARATPPMTHSSQPAAGIDRIWRELRAGDSGLLATRVALALGFERVVLVGVQINALLNLYSDPYGPQFDFGTHYRHVWEGCVHEFAGRVTSMSGYTRHLLGAPAGAHAAAPA